MRISDWSSDVCSSDLAKLARQPRSTGSPPAQRSWSTVSHLSAPAVEKRTERACCSARRTLTAKRSTAQRLSKLGVSLSRQNRISGGSRETEENELIVMPQLRPEASRAVTTVTPVAKQPRARRQVRASKVIEPKHNRQIYRTDESRVGKAWCSTGR